MPSIALRKKLFLKLYGRKVSDEKLAELLPLIKCGFDGMTEDEIKVEVTGDRPDLLSSEGVARALKGFTGVEQGLAKMAITPSGMEFNVDKSVASVRPVLVAAQVQGVNFEEDDIVELMQLQEKLHVTMGRKRRKMAVGVHDASQLKPPFYYKAVSPKEISFVPLGKETRMDLKEILARHEKGIDYAFTLAHASAYPVIVDSQDQVLSFPPIINGVLTQVTDRTTDLLLEITGTDFETCNTALNILCQNFADRGARIKLVAIRGSNGTKTTPETKPTIMHVSTTEASKALGVKFSPNEAAECLLRQRIGAIPEGDYVACEIPRYRTDFLHPVDLVEEIALGYGYNKFQPKPPSIYTKGETSSLTRKINYAAELLIGAGYVEASTYIFTNVVKAAKARDATDLVRIKNPVNSEYDCLRKTLLPNLLEMLSKNTHYAYPQKIFEVGETVSKDDKADVKTVTEIRVCALSAHANASLSESASLACEVLDKLGLHCELSALASEKYLKGRVAKLIHNGKIIGDVGEIHPAVLAEFGILVPVAAFEARITKVTY
ncbi:TPA: phenylalanine--tRNA ligase subunit beta [Candidatus Micrarchaeota archaeon]|nr:MAG: phenylalanine--tRNA ligase subunit beta [Candidatus Micrarchaeota archaeon CG1_02_51_15]HII39247.1 phenylalanine--tRNA ligase subunit beta [Candidatus Micrarchaeota archaeon]